MLTEIVTGMLGEKYRISLKHERKTWTNISKSFQQGIKKECDSGLLPALALFSKICRMDFKNILDDPSLKLCRFARK